MLQLTLLR